MYMEYMVVWLHDFTDTYHSVHGFDQIDDAEAFYQKLATNNPNIFSCLGKVEIVEQQFTSSAIFDGLPPPSKDRASGTEEDDSVDWLKRRLIQGKAAWVAHAAAERDLQIFSDSIMARMTLLLLRRKALLVRAV